MSMMLNAPSAQLRTRVIEELNASTQLRAYLQQEQTRLDGYLRIAELPQVPQLQGAARVLSDLLELATTNPR